MNICVTVELERRTEIVRKDQAGLPTSFGAIRYNRIYFKPKKEGSRKYLVDEIVGINPHDRVSADVVINSPFQ